MKYFKYNGEKVKHGDSVTCAIRDDEGGYHTITDAKVSINDNGAIYICQNQVAGAIALDLLGYETSWYIGSVNGFRSMPHDITNFKLVVKDNYEIY